MTLSPFFLVAFATNIIARSSSPSAAFAYHNLPQKASLALSSTRFSSTSTKMSSNNSNNNNNNDGKLTILGFGSLLSETSSRMTFPELTNFRLGRIPNYRRVFGHCTSLFFKRGIANLETKEMASLSAEPDEGNPGFICTIFEVDNADMMQDGVPSQAFLEREEEYNILPAVPFVDLTTGQTSTGILCARGSDKEFNERWGKDYFEKEYGQYGIPTIWNWDEASGLRPCATYLRHCTLAAEKMGEECNNSFLDETFLVDRKTPLRKYLKENPHVMLAVPPPELLIRYGG